MDKQQGNDSMAQWVTVKEAAAMLDMTESGVTYLLRAKRIEAVKPGRDWWISRASVETYKAERDKPKE